MMSLPPLMLTNLDEIFIGGTSHHGLPPCKNSIQIGALKVPKILFENQKLEKNDSENRL